MVLFAFVYLGSVLFWGAYCVNLVFPEIAAYFGRVGGFDIVEVAEHQGGVA